MNLREQFKQKTGRCTEKDYIELLGLDNPYPLKHVLVRLKWATEYLLNEKSYDGNNYEELERCVRRAEEIVRMLERKDEEDK